MKNKILSISIILILLSFIFINNLVFASSEYSSVTVKVTSVGCPEYGQYVTQLLPEDIKKTDDLHFIYCWSGLYHKALLYIAEDWTSTTIFKLSSDYRYLFAYDTATGETYDFKIYDNSKDTPPTFIETCPNLYWNGDIYFQNGFPNLQIYTDPIYFDNMTLANKASEEISFFFQGLTLAETLALSNPTKTFQTMMRGIIPYLIALVVGLVAFWKAWQLLLKELRKA